MIYTKQTKTAMQICLAAHYGQEDKAGYPYVFHPFHVAEQMDDETTTAAALLHDVLEDSKAWTAEALRNAGISEKVVKIVETLTHKPGVSYGDYIAAIKTNPDAVKVKLADLEHNSDFSRISNITSKDIERVKKYEQAIKFLREEKS